MKVFCNKCGKELFEDYMNELEKEEFSNEGCFVCSDCINEEMEKEGVLK